MIVVAISDTHCRHKELDLPKGDVLVHSGDACINGSQDELINFLIWFDEQPFEHKIFVPGNHDRCLEHLMKEDAEEEFFLSLKKKGLITRDNLHYLRDRSIEIELGVKGGAKFYGAPWQPFFRDWAFQRYRGTDMAEKWDLIPEDTDVLITHGPPYGHGDMAPAYDISKYPRHAGCFELLKQVRKIKPRLHIFGHIHAGYGRTQSDEVKTVFVNAASCGENYLGRMNRPQAIDLDYL